MTTDTTPTNNQPTDTLPTPTDLVMLAQRAREQLAAARADEAAALEAFEEALRAAYVANPDHGPTALAREIGVSEGTLRGYTRDLARARKREQAG